VQNGMIHGTSFHSHKFVESNLVIAYPRQLLDVTCSCFRVRLLLALPHLVHRVLFCALSYLASSQS
jgi:hypothetical protein